VWVLVACHPAQSPERAPAPTASVTQTPEAPVASLGPAPPTALVGSAAPVGSTTPVGPPDGASHLAVAPPATRPRPSMEACAATMFTPDCSEAFPPKVACPAKFSDVQVGAYCGLEGRTQPPAACRYAEATCKCKHIEYCGGVTPTTLQQMGMTWVCEAPRSEVDCPEQASPGGHCSTAGQACDYRACGSATQCLCSSGKYRCSTRALSMPP